MFKREHGITLVALVVTIIILLILAGVALTIALKDNGLFDYSKQAANAYRNSATNEAKSLNDVTGEMGNLINEID